MTRTRQRLQLATGTTPRVGPAYTAPTTPTWEWFALLAENARDSMSTGRCAIYGDPISIGQRVADLADGRGVAHTSCVGREASRP